MSDLKRHTFAFITDEIVYEYHAQALQGIYHQAQKSGVTIIVYAGLGYSAPIDNCQNANEIYEFIDRSRVDGIITLTSTLLSYLADSQKLQVYNALTKSLPAVSIGAELEGYDSILVDYRSGMSELVNHLVKEHNYASIAYIGGSVENPEAVARCTAFKEALRANSITPNDSLFYEGDFTPASAVEGIRTLLDERGVLFEVVVCATDGMAFEVVRELEARGIAVPAKIAVTGFDNVDNAYVSNPPLTSISQPMFEVGKHAVQKLLAVVNEEGAVSEISFPTNLVVRKSCGCMVEKLLESDASGSQGDGGLLTETAINNKDNRRQFLTYIEGYLGHGDNSQFFVYFDKFLQRVVDGSEIVQVNNLISSVRNQLFKDGLHFNYSLSDKSSKIGRGGVLKGRRVINSEVQGLIGELYSIEELLHEARIMVAHKSEKIQFLDKISKATISSDIIQIGESILTSYSREDLYQVLQDNLPRAGVNSCTLVAYADPETDVGRKKGSILFHYNLALRDVEQEVAEEDSEKNISAESDLDADGYFSTGLLLPESCWVDESRQSLLYFVLPLYYDAQRIGYIVYQGTRLLRQFYPIIAGNISNAFKSTEIYQNLQIAESSLRKRSEKITELVTPMIESIVQVNAVSTKEIATIKSLSEITSSGLEKIKMVSKTIEEASSNISNMLMMIEIIDDISSNINILAINASIESSHAGEYGLGFQVIAHEVQQLSDSTAKNAKEISDSLKYIVKSIRDSLTASNENYEMFEKVKLHVDEVTQILGNILDTMGELSDSSNEILLELDK